MKKIKIIPDEKVLTPPRRSIAVDVSSVSDTIPFAELHPTKVRLGGYAPVKNKGMDSENGSTGLSNDAGFANLIDPVHFPEHSSYVSTAHVKRALPSKSRQAHRG